SLHSIPIATPSHAFALSFPTPSHVPSSSSPTQTPTTQIYTLSLHDALPISGRRRRARPRRDAPCYRALGSRRRQSRWRGCSSSRSEEHTSELQSPDHLVCRLLLEKKKKKIIIYVIKYKEVNPR